MTVNSRIGNSYASHFAGKHWNKWLGILGVGLLFVALRWNSYDAPLIRDEGEYAYAAQLLVQGVAPYEHAFIQKPPMVIYSYAFSGLLLPHVFWAPRLLAYGFVGLATLLLGFIARREFGTGVALPTIWLATPMILLPGIDQFTANTEMFMLLPLLATVFVYVHSRHHGQQQKFWLAAGFLGATTLCYKYTALPVLAVLYVVWSVETWRQTGDAKQLLKGWLSAILGGLLAVGLEVGFFLIHDGGVRLWECTVLFNRYYIESSNFGLGGLLFNLKNLWSNWWILFFIPFAAFLKPNPRIWFWIAMLVGAFFSTSTSFYGQYYIILMPFWALLSAVGIRALASCIADWSGRPTMWIACLIASVVVLLVLQSDVSWLICTRERFAGEKMASYPFRESQTVAARVAQLSSPDDFVFIAGSEPQILYYAQRFSPTRFITVYSLMIPSPMARKYQQEAMLDLQKRPPSLIVFVSSPNSWTLHETTPWDFLIFLDDFLKKNYDMTDRYVIDGQKGHWSESLTNGELANPSLVIFKRKRLASGAAVETPR